MAEQQEKTGGGRRAVREARLADKLRQNLARRKAKARALRDGASSTDASPEPRTRRNRRDDNGEREL